MGYTTDSIKKFLTQTEPFSRLDSQTIDGLVEKLQPLRFPMGRVIIRRENKPAQVAIICEGEARWLGYDPRKEEPITLAKLGAGSVLGWVNLARGVSCETAIASTKEVICLILSNQDFLRLLAAHDEFRQYFHDQCSLLEIFDVLGYQLNKQAIGGGQIKDLAKYLQDEARLEHLQPGKYGEGGGAAWNAPWHDENWVWLVSGGQINEHPAGTQLKELNSTVEVFGDTAARLIGFPKKSWTEIIAEAKTEEIPEDSLTEGEWTQVQDSAYLNGHGDSNIDIEEGAIQEVELPEPPPIEVSQKQYPFIAGKTPEDAASACFQMISKHFNMPFRRELIKKIVKEQVVRQGKVSLDASGAICELMGLSAQLIQIPGSAFSSLEGPAMVSWEGSLAVVYEISKKSVLIAVPEVGLLRKTPEEFIRTWENSQDGDKSKVLLLKRNKETQTQRFGLKWFLPEIKKHKKVLIEVLIASFFVQLFALANPLMIQVIIDKVIVQNSSETLHVLGVFLLVVGIFEGVLTYLRTTLFVDTTNRIDMSLGSEIINHLLRLPLRYFEKRPVGEISTRINELENIRQFLTGTALTVVLDAIFSVVYIVIMIVYSPILTLVALSIIPIFAGLALWVSPILRDQLRDKAERNAETQSYLVEVMTGIQTVKAQNIELRSRWQWQERYARYVDAGFTTVNTSTAASTLSNFLNKLSGLMVLWWGAFLVLEGDLTLGQLIAFRIIANYVTSPLLRLTQIWQNFQETALSLERLADIVDTPQEAEQDRENIPMPLISGGVKYEDVSFRFKQHAALQLVNVSIDIKPGTFVAVVGQSGAGKSTLTKLLSRLYEPESGRIIMDGYDINKVELYSLRRQIGVVPQDTLLFEGSVQDNIALTNPDATTEEIIEAARIAAAHDFIMTLPNGYNTKVGERGASLSGGQRQRIAIARTVLQNPRVLVLDEATSALDYSTEQEVCHNLLAGFRDRTVFFITHRLGTIKRADVIILMDSGTVAEMGTHEELMALKGRYYCLYQQQESKV